VAFLGHIPGFGMTLILDHEDDYHTVYGNLYKALVSLGEAVDEKQTLGIVKALKTGDAPYLYFEVREKRLAVDPRPWFLLRALKKR
jgi:murein hydrolase activator